MKKNNSQAIIFYLIIISLYSCASSKRVVVEGILLSKVTKKDKNRPIGTLYIDTLGLKKLKSLKKVSTYEYGENNKVTIESAIDMLSQLDAVHSLVFRRIEHFPDNISKLKTLEYLCIFGANIEDLPESIGQLNNLYILRIGYSMYDSGVEHKIKKLPNSIIELKNLGRLSLNGTHINTFPLVLCNMKKLHHLDISGTVMDSIPDCICKLESFNTYQMDALEKLPCRDKFIIKDAIAEPDTTKKRKYYFHNFWMRIWAK